MQTRNSGKDLEETHVRFLKVERLKMARAFGVCVGFGTKLGISVLHEKQEDSVT